LWGAIIPRSGEDQERRKGGVEKVGKKVATNIVHEGDKVNKQAKGWKKLGGTLV